MMHVDIGFDCKDFQLDLKLCLADIIVSSSLLIIQKKFLVLNELLHFKFIHYMF